MSSESEEEPRGSNTPPVRASPGSELAPVEIAEEPSVLAPAAAPLQAQETLPMSWAESVRQQLQRANDALEEVTGWDLDGDGKVGASK